MPRIKGAFLFFLGIESLCREFRGGAFVNAFWGGGCKEALAAHNPQICLENIPFCSIHLFNVCSECQSNFYLLCCFVVFYLLCCFVVFFFFTLTFLQLHPCASDRTLLWRQEREKILVCCSMLTALLKAALF